MLKAGFSLIESANMTVKEISVMKSERISGRLVYTAL